MSRMIIACAVSLAVGLATGLALRPVVQTSVAAEGLAPTAGLAAGPDSGTTRVRTSFHPLM